MIQLLPPPSKRLFFVLFFLSLSILGTSVTLAQDDFICTYDPSTDGLDDPGDGTTPIIHNSGSIDPAFLDTFEPKLFNVYFWQVNDANGNFGTAGIPGNEALEETITKGLQSIAYLNQQFNEFKIFFKYRGVGQIDSPSALVGLPYGSCSQNAIDDFYQMGFTILNNCQTGALKQHAINTGNYNENAINIFLPSGTTGFGGKTVGTAYFVRRNLADKGASAHEMGHIFGLYEMFSSFQAPQYIPENECEHVTRDLTSTDFNAIPQNISQQGRGDQILDTNAVPDFHREWCWNNGIDPYVSSTECTEALLEDPTRVDYNLVHNQLDNTCYYNGLGEDCQGSQYDISPEDTQNFMAYTISACRNQFTIGQAIHMHEDVLDQLENKYQYVMEDDFSSLYEPYDGEYYAGGPFYPELHTPLFQPGFDYTFVTCEGPYVQPAPFGETFTAYSQQRILEIDAFEDDFSSITHPNHTAIIIDQIDQAHGFARIEKCYDNYNRAPKGGRVVRFNDGVFNYNTTTTEKDSTGINTATLVQDLVPGLYKVEKDYDGGTTTQTIIQKNND